MTRKRVNKEHVTSDDLGKYKKILLLTNAHLEGYQPGGSLSQPREKIPRNYRPAFREAKGQDVESGLCRAWKNTKMTARALYYNPEKQSAFSTVNKHSAALPKKNKSDVKAWLEHQDAYTMHRPVRKRFLRNPYTVSNIMDLWECDLLDMQSLAKYNDTYRYILYVIDVFSKYLHLVPVKTKSGPAFT